MWRATLPLLLACSAVRLSVAHRFLDRRAAYARAYERVELMEESFLTNTWRALEGELVQLERLADPRPKAGQMSTLQVFASPVQQEPAKKEAAKGLPIDLKAQLATARATSMVKGAVSKAMLEPMLEMLKGLYQQQKGRIVKINKQEEKSKNNYDQQEKDYKIRCARIESNFKLHKISEKIHHNETRDNDHQFEYWKRCRERNHRQFHNSLKITHASMEKEKQMIKAYEETLSAPSPTKDGAAALAKVAKDVGMPEIVFAQLAPAVTSFCQISISEVRKALSELNSTS